MVVLENQMPRNTMDSHSGDCSEPMLCFDRKTLSAFLAGTYGKDSSSLELHLEQCQECRSLLQKIEEEPDSVGVLLQGIELQEVMKETERTDRDLPAKETNDGGDWVLQHRELGAYELIEPLGRGGMGSVYLALHQALGKQVAIKVLPRGMLTNSDAIARFQRETLAAGRLDHSAIVRATDAGEHRGIHYLVMDRIRGLDLSRLARALGPMPIADACEMIRQVALGLTYAHEQGMVHRDIKPSNLMLDESGQVKILDFGLVQFDGWDSPQQELTTVGQLMGTLDYMAPEQAERSGGVDHRADLYSLGATLFRLLSGRAPLVATPHQSPLEKLRLLIHHQPPSLRLFCPNAPEALVALVDQLLDSDPKKRPPSAAHVALALEPFTSGHNLKACLQKGMQVKDIEPSQQARVPFPTASKSSIAQPQSTEPSQPQGSGRGYRNWIFAIALALLPLAGWFGYILVLDAQTGQLVIDSEVSGIQVKLVQRGKEATSLSIETGTTTSRLWVDRYEIILETPSDTVEIENGAFSIRRGKTVVARIRTKSNADRVDGDMPNVASLPNEPRYEDRTFSQWLEVLENERSNAKILVALKAMGQLKSDRNGDSLAKTLKETVIARTSYYRGNFRSFDDVLGQAMRLLLSQSITTEQLQREFIESSDKVRYGILCYLNEVENNQSVDRKNFLRWVFQQTQASTASSPPKIKLSEETNDLFVALLWGRLDVTSNPSDFQMLLSVRARHWIRGFHDISKLSEFLENYEGNWNEIRMRLAERLLDDDLDSYDEATIQGLLLKIGFGDDINVRKSLLKGLDKSLANHLESFENENLSNKSDRNLGLTDIGAIIDVKQELQTNGLIGPVPVSLDMNLNNIFINSRETQLALRRLQIYLYVPVEERPRELIGKILTLTELNYKQVMNLLNESGDSNRNLASSNQMAVLAQKRKERKTVLHFMSSSVKWGYLCHLTAKLLLEHPVYPVSDELWNELELPVWEKSKGELISNELETFQQLGGSKLGFVDWSSFKTLTSLKENYDINSDGYLTFAELNRFPDGSQSDQITWGVKTIKEMDKNNDRQLSVDEWVTTNGDFKAIDQNSDGLITEYEYFEYRKQIVGIKKGLDASKPDR